VAIGNFDGVHRGHQAVLEATARTAASVAGPMAVMVFEPHPRTFFRPDLSLFRLTPLEVKAHLMSALGVDCLAVLDFDAGLAAVPARDFVADILVRGLGVRHVVIGYDFCFGKARQGNAGLLREMGAELGFGVTVVERVNAHGEDAAPYSSSEIRCLLQDGRPREAADLLGYWWTVIGEVVEGDRRGRTIGFPTANIRLAGQGEPHLGVYAVRARPVDGAGGDVWAGVANLGRRPTFEKQDVLLEVNLFDFAGDLYGRKLIVEFVDFLRPEQKFDGLDALKAQIAADAAKARDIHARMARDGDPMTRFPLGRRFAAGA
ncbi:MAG TPA: bifunctional riboflavin kinase/FAD synthetase, partial [Hyphomicrobiales bacterium]|nr:bifunctional riboflavin kinase/FAD synthetase [Hyphomicrobiales bacterium]